MTRPTRIKVCGVTQPDDAARVAAAGVDFLGLNFWPRSKRYLSPERAFAVADAARAAGPAQLVGVFVDSEVADVIAIAQALGLDAIQLHGDEPVADARAIAEATLRPVWKAIAVGAAADVDRLAAWPAVDPYAPAWSLAAVLLDAPSAGRGGAGQVFDWRLAREAVERYPAHRLVLAGGLGPRNVAAAIAQVAPWAVDVASGVEASPGVKDPVKVAAFVAAVRLTGRA